MKFAASRSLLHGTVGRGARRERASYAAQASRGRRTSRAAGSRAPGRSRGSRLPREHVEVAGEPRPGVQPAARRRRARASTPGSAKSALVSAVPGRKPMHQHRRGRGGTRRPARRPRACRGGRVLACSASRSMPSSAGVALTSTAPRRRPSSSVTRTLWLVSPPGRSATEPGPPRRDPVEAVQVAVGHGRPTQSSKASTTAWSMVCFGPVNQFLAETFHQIVSSSSAPRVTIGA